MRLVIRKLIVLNVYGSPAMMDVSEINVNDFVLSALDSVPEIVFLSFATERCKKFSWTSEVNSEHCKLNKCDPSFKNADQLVPVNSKWMRICMKCLSA